ERDRGDGGPDLSGPAAGQQDRSGAACGGDEPADGVAVEPGERRGPNTERRPGQPPVAADDVGGFEVPSAHGVQGGHGSPPQAETAPRIAVALRAGRRPFTASPAHGSAPAVSAPRPAPPRAPRSTGSCRGTPGGR